ncbi:phosphoribosylamine--glycine ligase [Bacteroidota bacterium]
MNVLIIGSGGREHTIAWKIHQSPNCQNLFVAPGNAGTQTIATNVNISPSDFGAIEEFVIKNKINLVVIGPEAPLVDGIRDYFESTELLRDIPFVGPTKKGAMLEGSKDFANQFMANHNIPTAGSRTFTVKDLDEAYDYIEKQNLPVVLKADGLAAGKGVLICPTHEEAKDNIREMLEEKKFGSASEKVVIEDFLNGIELSVFVLTDGKDYVLLPEAKDYKRIGEHDTGPNTGGMGSVSPVNFANTTFLQKVENRIIKPTIQGLQKDEITFNGFIFIGLMNVNGDPYVIEYNVRMGDPEAQVVLPRIKSDFLELLNLTATGNLNNYILQVDPDTAVTVIMASAGYPDNYEKGKVINGLNVVNNATVFHAGTRINDENEVETNGGRVLAVTGIGNTLESALNEAYEGIERISWDGLVYRKDIGQDLLAL